ncbi:MAG: ATP-binding cassette domain-containing protein [Anaerolineales bacterium]|nr:ATP-binding cassette domain-containing protein [Anaerolineales bacterium]MBP6210615.1 ATP-binding cassette domain-containing protein [Anaerolineales bacterium]
MIEVQGLSKSFGKVQAVKDVSFSARDGQITGLLGPNGAGKSTTLRMLYTLLKPDNGSAQIDGFDVRQNPIEVQKRIGVLADARGLYPRLTSRENIRYYGRLHGMEGEALEKQISSLVTLLDMQSIADRKTEGFSTGEKLKVAIARTLVHNPQNVLLDEPTNGLDVMSTRAMRQFILRLRDEGKCVLFTSHIMQEVAALCDQIVIISQGSVSANGSPNDLRKQTGKENLEDAFVAAIGSEEGLMQ